MKNQTIQLITFLLVFTLFSCNNNSGSNDSGNTSGDPFEASVAKQKAREQEASEMTRKMCANFPEALVFGYNPDGKRIEIETVELVPGKLSPCKVKLFYGKRDYDYWEGQVGVWASKTKDPLWQYSPERNPNAYHNVTEFGGKGVFITGTNQLMVLKDGMVYSIVAPCRRNTTTSSGKSIKELVMQIARHYKI